VKTLEVIMDVEDGIKAWLPVETAPGGRGVANPMTLCGNFRYVSSCQPR